MLVYTTGRGVHGFTLDPMLGEFPLSRPDMRIPDRGRYLSVNDSYEPLWTDPVRALIRAASTAVASDGKRLILDTSRRAAPANAALYRQQTRCADSQRMSVGVIVGCCRRALSATGQRRARS
jgi:hypothetical protein